VVERKDARVFNEFGLNMLDWEAGSVLEGTSFRVDGNAERVLDDFGWRCVDVAADVAPSTDSYAA